MALVTSVYTNIAIFWQLLRFNSLKKHFPQIYRFKRFENVLGKKVPDLKFFPWFWLKTPCFSLISLTRKSLQKFPWFPWSVGTLRYLMHNHFPTRNHFIRPIKFHELNSAWFISSWKDSMNKYCVYMDSKIPNVVLYMYKYYIQQKYMYMHWKIYYISTAVKGMVDLMDMLQ